VVAEADFYQTATLGLVATDGKVRLQYWLLRKLLVEALDVGAV
jgi:hypothetical protein